MGMGMRYTTSDGSLSFPLRFVAGGADAITRDAYEYAASLGSISKWQRASKEIPLDLAAITEKDRALIDEALHLDAEKGADGTLSAGEWELRCRMSAISWTQWELPWYLATASVTLLSADGTWRRSTRVELPANSAREITVDGLDYDSPTGMDPGLDYGLDMPDAPNAPVFTVQPGDVRADSTTEAVVSAHAAGYRVAYQWQMLAGGWVRAPWDGNGTSAMRMPVGTEATVRCVSSDALGQTGTSEQARIEVTDTVGAGNHDFPFDYGSTKGGVFSMDASMREESWSGGTGSYGDVPGYDLGGTLFGTPFEVPCLTGALLRIQFHGQCSQPYVSVAGNRYSVDASAARGEKIVVDPTRRREIGGSIYRADRYGDTANLYDKRPRGLPGSGSYVFERVPAGEHWASWPQTIDVELDVIEERGAPPWN